MNKNSNMGKFLFYTKTNDSFSELASIEGGVNVNNGTKEGGPSPRGWTRRGGASRTRWVRNQ
eukprot:4311316-Alexandrium_andersonii.AAC.1